MSDCVFCKIVQGELPAQFVYQDNDLMVFPDIHPSAPIHLLFVPKIHIDDFTGAPARLVTKIHSLMLDKIKELDLTPKGYRIVVNGGVARQVNHLHFHLLGEIAKDRYV